MPRARRGFALITALSLLAIMSLLAYSFQSAMELNDAVAQANLWELQARYAARGGIAEAEAALLANVETTLLAEPHELGDGLVAVRVEDVSGKLHLNLAPAAEVARLLGLPDAKRVEAARPIASVYDAYAALDLRPDQFETARRYTTVHGDGGVDFNLAPRAVLAALTGLSRAQADAIVRYRNGPDGQAGTADDRDVNTAAGLAAVPGENDSVVPALARRMRPGGRWYRVVAEGRAVHRGRTRRTVRIEAVLRRGRTDFAPVVWIEGAPSA